jgi:replication-associated recombination protein RarA
LNKNSSKKSFSYFKSKSFNLSRPKTVEDVSDQGEITAVLKKVIGNTSGEFPNFLFYGPPGTGKTSTILAAGKKRVYLFK